MTNCPKLRKGRALLTGIDKSLREAITRSGPNVQGKGIPNHSAINAPQIEATKPIDNFQINFTSPQPVKNAYYRKN